MEMMNALLVEEKNGKAVMAVGKTQKPKPSKHELLIKIEATSLNRADLLQKSGKYPPPKGASEILGLEMAGQVVGAGRSVQNFTVGDSVFGLLPGGGYSEYCVIPESMALQVPDSFSYEEAAAISEVFLTAYQALIWLGELSDKQHVLIHAGASGVGTAAIQLATQLKGATVCTTSGSKRKQDICASLGAEININYKEQNFADVIEAGLGKERINLIIDFIGKPFWDQNIRLLAVDGRLVYLAMMGGATVENMSLVPILRKRLAIKGSTLRNRTTEYKARLTQEFATNCMHLFQNGKLKPVIDSVYDWNDVESAHQRMEQNENAGKIVMSVV
jgi:putative PIG3 family NAD(P)H quinone oxidoreductase